MLVYIYVAINIVKIHSAA